MSRPRLRTVHNDEPLMWLRDNVGAGPIITSPPDYDAVKDEMSFEKWAAWFRDVVYICCVVAEDHPVVFYATDRRDGAYWISKAHMILDEAEKAGMAPVFHKVATRRRHREDDTDRPTYSHMIAFNGRPDAGVFPNDADVFYCGSVRDPDDFGITAARFAVAWVTTQDYGPVIVPFSRYGRNVLSAADLAGVRSIGIDKTQPLASKEIES